MSSEIRVNANPEIPHDPLSFKTMDDYDLNLSLYRTWFEYDQSRNPIPGIIQKWEFIKDSGFYLFTIDKRAKWSDGTNITSDHIVKNINKAIKFNTNFGETINKIIDVKEIKIVNDSSFKIKMTNNLPNKDLFLRMGSAFLAMTHPSDWNTEGNISKNSLTSGPYKIVEITDKEVILERNSFDFLALKTTPQKVVIRRKSPDYNLADFVKGKTWSNVHRENSLISSDLIKSIEKNKTPYWTRGVDRVALLRPTNGSRLRDRKQALKELGFVWNSDSPKKLPFDSKIALSLQPLGYPLFNEFKYPQGSLEKIKSREFKVVTYDNLTNVYLKELLDDICSKKGIKLKWEIKKSLGELLKVYKESEEYDFSLFSFGVADPDPATWLALVFSEEYGMVTKTKGQFEKYKEILKINDKALSVQKFRELMTEIGIDGGYLPLVHFSTLVLGHKGMDFSNIDSLDETVNFSKIIFR